MLINEFAEDFKHSGEAQFYGINGSICAPSLPYFECQGETVLATFDFAQRRSTMTSDLKARPFALLSAENVPSL